MKYKIGDKVTLTNGNTMTIDQIDNISKWYRMREDPWNCYTDEMIEGLVEEEIKNWADTSIPDGPYTVTYDSPAMNDSMNKNNIHNEIILPKGYIFKDENGNVINATKIILEKNEYPKTYEECCEIFQYNKNLKVYPPFNADIPNYDALHLFDLLESLRKLLICRDAYWKIAGEEMGLGKPWEQCDSKVCYGIITVAGEIQHDTIAKWRILTFPTEEMRDTFYENFKSDIEVCKEFL